MKSKSKPIQTPAEIASCLDKYIEEHDQKAQAIEEAFREKHEDASKELELAEAGMKKAAERGDVDLAMKYAAKKTESEKTLNQLAAAFSSMESAPTFPEGSVKQEWKKICDEYQPAYMAALEVVRETALAYKTAFASFMELHETLRAARSIMQLTAEKHGSEEQLVERILTKGMRSEDYILITKDETLKVGTAVDPTWSIGL